MFCPFCNANMEKGVLMGGRPRLRWSKDENYTDPFVPFISPKTSILTKTYELNNLTGYRCANCNKLILDIHNNK